jgi:hypothetical protein
VWAPGSTDKEDVTALGEMLPGLQEDAAESPTRVLLPQLITSGLLALELLWSRVLTILRSAPRSRSGP